MRLSVWSSVVCSSYLDTSGAYTDPDARIDLAAVLAALRASWIAERVDSALLGGMSSQFGQQRLADAWLDAIRFPALRAPRRALAGANVSQMHYARRGIVTPEMEFIAISENQRIAAIAAAQLLRQHTGQHFGANRSEDHTSELQSLIRP